MQQDPKLRRVWAIARPGSLANLRLEDEILPPPPAHHVQVKVRAIGLNFADIFAILGLYSATPKERFIPGFEVAGTVEAVGAGEEQSRWLGQRVYCTTRFGGYADYINADVRYVKITPDSWTDQEACAFTAQGMTAFYALRELGSLYTQYKNPRQKTVLVHSAAGGVGLLALGILAKASAKVVGTVGNPSKLDLLHSKYGDNPNFKFILRSPARDFESRGRDALRAIDPDADGFDIVLDSVMGDWFWPNHNLLDKAGRHIVFGSASFTPSRTALSIIESLKLAWKWLWKPMLDPMSLIKSNKSVLGFNLIHIYHQDDVLNSVFDDLNDLHLDAPHVGHEISFEKAHEAISLLQSGKTVGKVVLIVDH